MSFHSDMIKRYQLFKSTTCAMSKAPTATFQCDWNWMDAMQAKIRHALLLNTANCNQISKPIWDMLKLTSYSIYLFALIHFSIQIRVWPTFNINRTRTATIFHLKRIKWIEMRMFTTKDTHGDRIIANDRATQMLENVVFYNISIWKSIAYGIVLRFNCMRLRLLIHTCVPMVPKTQCGWDCVSLRQCTAHHKWIVFL